MNSSYYKMNKTRKRVFCNFLFTVFLLVFATSLRLDALTSDVSKIKLQRIANIIREFTDAKEKLTDSFVKEAIFDKVGREMTLEPDEKPNKKAISEIASDVRKIVRKRFPSSVKDIKAKAIKEAGKKYKLKNKLDFVTVTMVRGGRSNIVSGVFYRFGIGGNSVVIGDHTPIAFMDLKESDRAKFDKNFCAKKRKEYIEKKVRTYYKRKQSFLNQCFADEREKVSTDNAEMGYIYIWNKWRTPKEVTEYLIKQNIRQTAKQDKTETPDGELPDLPDTTVETPDETTETPDTTVHDDDATLKLARLKQEVEKRQMEIAGSQYGIDADQAFSKGDLVVLIGLTQDEVNLLTGLKSEGNTATLSYPKGVIDKVIFSFVNQVLYKIEVIYRIGPPEGMELLWDSIKDLYGESAEMVEASKKEREKQTRLKAIRRMCKKDKKGKDTHKWAKNGICSKCGVRRDDLAVPVVKKDIQLTWPGKVIVAKLLISLTDDKLNFKKFVFVKENLYIKGEQEAIIKEENLRKLEEEKQKRIDEFKNDLK